MAKRKKSKPTAKRTVRRRRVGAIDKNLINNVLFAALGGVAAKFVSSAIGNISLTGSPDTDAKIKAALPLVGGAVLAGTMGKKDSKMMYLGLGMVAYGATSLATELGVMSGIDNMIAGYLPQRRNNYLNGAGDIPNVAGNNYERTKVAAMMC